MYKIIYEEKAVRQIKKLDPSVKKLIRSWIEKNLVDTENPRIHGKGLTGDKSGYWRYRVGDYRIIAEINDTEITIIIIEVAHRTKVYKSLT